MVINGLILAAGMSRRMQQFKPLMKLGNKTIIETTVEQMLSAGVDQITVVLGYRGSEIQKVLEKDQKMKKRVRFVYNFEFEKTQMLDSVKIGIKELKECERFFIVPGDMPAISAETYLRLTEQAKKHSEAKVIFPTIEGYRKHPPLISWSCRKDILHFEGNGLRELWKQYEGCVAEIPWKDNGCTLDIDTVEDYQRLCRYLKEKKMELHRNE